MGVRPSLRLHTGNSPREHTLNITDSPSPNGHRLLLAPQPGVQAAELLLRSAQDVVDLVFCRPRASCDFLNGAVLRRRSFKVPSPFQPLALTMPSSRMQHESALGADSCPVWGCAFYRHLLCYWTSCKPLNYLSIHWANMLLWWGLRAALICVHRDMYLEGNLILCPVSKLIVIGSHLALKVLKARLSLTVRAVVSALAAPWILPLSQPKPCSCVGFTHLLGAP